MSCIYANSIITCEIIFCILVLILFLTVLVVPKTAVIFGLEKDEEMAKNLKKYKAEDQDVSMLLSGKDCEKHRMLKNEWNKWVNEWKQLNEVEIKEILDVSEE